MIVVGVAGKTPSPLRPSSGCFVVLPYLCLRIRLHKQ